MPKISQYTELAETPASTDEFVIVDKSDTSEAASGTTKKIQAQYLTIADASTTVKGKVELATDAETITGTDTVRAVTPSNITAKQASDAEAITGTSTTKLITPANVTASAPTFIATAEHAATSKTTPVDADEIGLIDSAASYVLKKLSFLNLKVAVGSYLNPVGTIREFNVSTNPNTLLGFGTWSAYGTGMVTVAIDAGQTEFDTLGETGGEKAHLLTAAESGLPAHNHQILQNFDSTSNTGHVRSGSTSSAGLDNGPIQNNSAQSASQAHNNLQPYIVVYRWVRTS